MTKRLLIEVRGVPMEVAGDWDPPVAARLTADPYHSTPAAGGEFVPSEILVSGIDILSLLADGKSDGVFLEICAECEDVISEEG